MAVSSVCSLYALVGASVCLALLMGFEWSASRAVQSGGLLSHLRGILPRRQQWRQVGAGDTQCYTAEAMESANMLWAAGRASCDPYNAMAGSDYAEEEAKGGGAAMGALSVIIGAYQRPVTLDLQLRALSQQKHVSVEVIVVDGGSDPPMSTCLAHAPCHAAWHAMLYRVHDGQYHRVRNFNEGVALAKHPTIVLLDDDVVPMSDYWAYGAVRAMAMPMPVGEGGDGEAPDIVRLPMVIKELRANLSDVAGRIQEISTIDSWSASYPGFTSCNLAIRADTWKALGGFDGQMDGRYGGEDEDFHRRAKEAGAKYARGPPYSCALHVGVFYGNRGLPTP